MILSSQNVSIDNIFFVLSISVTVVNIGWVRIQKDLILSKNSYRFYSNFYFLANIS